MQHSTAQHSTAQHTAQHSTAQHSTAQHSTTQHNTTQHSTAKHDPTQLSIVLHYTALHGTALYYQARPFAALHNTTQQNTTKHNTTFLNLLFHQGTQTAHYGRLASLGAARRESVAPSKNIHRRSHALAEAVMARVTPAALEQETVFTIGDIQEEVREFSGV